MSNEPAFPAVQGTDGHDNMTMEFAPDGRPIATHHNQGMTLRDYFAAAALQGWLASYNADAVHPAVDDCAESVARNSYALADAMLRERAKS